jgi:hypothetical protein
MLEGLDKVDWENVGFHVYGSNAEIPAAIRNLLSGDRAVRNEALNFLFGVGQDIGVVYDTTPYIVSFVLEILANPSVTGKADLLQCLVGISRVHIFMGGRETLSIQELRVQIYTYDALESGIPIYLKLLKDLSIKVRELAATLIGAMSDSAQLVSKELVEAFATEEQESVKVALVSAMGALLGATNTHQLKLRKDYAIWFLDLVETHPLIGVRRAAARASIFAAVGSLWNSLLRDDDVSPNVGDVLIEEYLDAPKEYYARRFLCQEIVDLLTRLQDTEPLLRLLEHPNITVDEAQTIVRGLLWNILERSQNAEEYWQYEIYGENKQTNIYKYSPRTLEPLYSDQRVIIERILKAERVWTMPTNLFSFFFGLPDSREELRALIESR